MSSEPWFCVNCNSIVLLDVHGRCSICDSDAVLRRALQHIALVQRLYPEPDDQVIELEKLWLRK